MKKLFILTILFLFTFCKHSELSAQNVVIPDSIFKAYLLGHIGINTDGDTVIQVSEAASFAGTLNCFNLGIADLTGIAAFTALTHLYCERNQLTNLDVSANTALVGLSCYDNQLTSLDVSANTALAGLSCYNNQLTSLNVSANTALILLYCDNNQLTSLNIQNGKNLSTPNPWFTADNNPDLSCIQVDDSAWSARNWTNIDSTVSFSTDCNFATSNSKSVEQIPNLKAYPNPTNGVLFLSLGKHYNKVKVQVSNIMNQVVFSKYYNGVQNLDLNLEGATGVYFVKIKTETGEATMRIIKE